MKTGTRAHRYRTLGMLCTLALTAFGAAAQSNPSPAYTTNTIISSVPGAGKRASAAVVNSWGIAAAPNRVVVAENGAGVITIHNPGGAILKTIAVPAPAGSTNLFGTPTGVAINPTRQFVIGATNGVRRASADILFVTEDGTIGGWASGISGTNAILQIDNSAIGAIYKGMAIGAATNGTFLYAANFGTGNIERYDSSFGLLQTFSDPALTNSGFAPFGVKVIQRKVFVTFAKVAQGGRDDEPGLGNGYIDIFNLEGNLVRGFAEQGQLNSPWGMAFAPTHFGRFSGNLLVGNFGDGRILAYNIITGEFLGALQSSSGGGDIVISGVWGLDFQREPAAGQYDFEAPVLWFAAGIMDETAGAVGNIKPVKPVQVPAR